jgi:hypothetical protein
VSDRTREQPPGTNLSLCAVTQVEERKRKWVKKRKKGQTKEKTQYTHNTMKTKKSGRCTSESRQNSNDLNDLPL